MLGVACILAAVAAPLQVLQPRPGPPVSDVRGHDTMAETVESDKQYEALAHMMSKLGMTGLDKLKAQTVGEGSHAHRGLVLTDDVIEHERVVTVPFHGMIRAQSEEVDTQIGDLLRCITKRANDSDIPNPLIYHGGPNKGFPYGQRILTLYLLHEKARQEQSPWHLYLSTLPHNFSLLEDLNDDDEAMMELEGTELSQAIKNKHDFKLAEHRLFKNLISYCDSDMQLPWAEWHWARNIVITRSFSYEMSQTPTGERRDDVCMIPFIDMGNHAAGCNVSWFTHHDRFYLYSGSPMKAGDEFFISYGENLDNYHLITFYGFVLEHNNDPVPSDCQLTDCTCVSAHLKAFKTSTNKDLAMLESRLSFNKHNAIKLRLEQHQVLLNQAVEQHCKADE